MNNLRKMGGIAALYMAAVRIAVYDIFARSCKESRSIVLPVTGSCSVCNTPVTPDLHKL
jgi:hypothetical protein